MPDQLQLRGGTTVQHSTFTGASKEVTVDTTKKTAVVHDGSTVGGNPLMREDASNSALALGSDAAPSLKFTGDPNTGIYSPGADQVAVATNGVQRINIEADGDINIDGGGMFYDATNNRLAIGSTVPDTALHMHGTFDSSSAFATTNSNKGLTISSSLAVATGVQYGVVFSSSQNTNTDYPVAGIMAIPVAASFGIGGSLSFQTHTSADTTLAERARIDPSGRLLIGTSSSRSWAGSSSQIQIEAAAAQATQSIIANSADNLGALLTLGKSRGTALASNTIVQADDILGRIYFYGADGSQLINGAHITAQVDGTPGTNDMPGRLVFSTTADGGSSPVEHLRINSEGTHSIWASSAPMVWGRNLTDGTVAALAFYNTATSTTSLAGQVFRVMCDGDVENANNAYGAISDASLKENIVDARSQWDDIKALQVRNYNFKAETGLNTHTQIGLVAQETELVSPGLVGECIDEKTGDATKTVNYSVLYMKAVKALQEAIERIETLEAKVAALESA
jgi:hypothetical protein